MKHELKAWQVWATQNVGGWHKRIQRSEHALRGKSKDILEHYWIFWNWWAMFFNVTSKYLNFHSSVEVKLLIL